MTTDRKECFHHLRSKRNTTDANHGQKHSHDHQELAACTGSTAVQIFSYNHLCVIKHSRKKYFTFH